MKLTQSLHIYLKKEIHYFPLLSRSTEDSAFIFETEGQGQTREHLNRAMSRRNAGGPKAFGVRLWSATAIGSPLSQCTRRRDVPV